MEEKVVREVRVGGGGGIWTRRFFWVSFCTRVLCYDIRAVLLISRKKMLLYYCVISFRVHSGMYEVSFPCMRLCSGTTTYHQHHHHHHIRDG
jgi:hypothetical protein